MKTKALRAKGGGRLAPYLFLIPVYAVIIVFKYIPFCMALEKSFFNWNGGNLNLFVGPGNFIEALKDAVFIESLANVARVAFAYVLIAVTVPLLAAELVFSLKSARAQYTVRTLFTFPMVVPGMVVILLWKWIFAGDYGILNMLLSNAGLDFLRRPWLGSSDTALSSIIFIGFPWLGMSMIAGMHFLVYFAALQSIPSDLYECAQLNGVNVFQRFFYIDVPLIASQLKLMISLSLIGSLQIFDSVFVLTRGGPGTSTMVPAVYIYEQGFNYGRMGYSSAIGVILFVLILLLTGINQKLLRNTDQMD